jgi:hypothetical protein
VISPCSLSIDLVPARQYLCLLALFRRAHVNTCRRDRIWSTKLYGKKQRAMDNVQNYETRNVKANLFRPGLSMKI